MRNRDLRNTLPFGPFLMVWDSITFPVFRPSLEKIIFFGSILMLIWRWSYQLTLHNWNTPILPGFLVGFTIKIPMIPFMKWPIWGWYFAMAFIVAMMIYSHRRLFRDNTDYIRDPTWTPMFYLMWTFMVIVGLLSYY